MTSPRQTGERQRGGYECDAFSRKARRLLVYLSRAGAVAKSKRAFNKRVRRHSIDLGEEVTNADGTLLNYDYGEDE